MESIGFSTGSLARGDVHAALAHMREAPVSAVELSALRTHELGPLLDAVPHLDLSRFRHVSVHAPGFFSAAEEAEVARALLGVAARGWPVILHPDTIHDVSCWEPFGGALCIENMDRRKAAGRSLRELDAVFRRLPRASLCFDIAHARQLDTSMTEAFSILSELGHRLAQVHVSELDGCSRHTRLTSAGVRACLEVAELIPADVPVIIEAPVTPAEMEDELARSLEALGRVPAGAHAAAASR